MKPPVHIGKDDDDAPCVVIILHPPLYIGLRTDSTELSVTELREITKEEQNDPNGSTLGS